MNVLFLLAYYNPETAASIYLFENLIEGLIKKGNNVDLIVPTPSRGIENETIKKYSCILEENGFENKLHIHRFKLYKEGKGNFSRFIRYFISLFKYIKVSKRIKNVDVIFCESTPPILSLAAEYIKKQKKVPLVYNLQDIFPDSLVLTGLVSKKSILYKIGLKIENRAYNTADKIITISEDFKNNILKKGANDNKIKVVYNWVDEQAVIDIPRANNVLFDRYKLDRSKFYVTYCGNIGLSQNIGLLVNTAIKLQGYTNIRFVLIGEGVYKEKLKKTILENDLNNITILPFQPYKEISNVFSLGDISLVISKPGTGNGCVPSKTWSIMSASRPVLANFDDCELKRIIDTSQSGIFTLAGDENAFINAILLFYNDPVLCKNCGINGRKFIIDNLTKKAGTDKYIEVLESFQR